MKILVDNVILSPDEDSSLLQDRIRELYSIDGDFSITILRRSLDARKKEKIVYRFRVVVDVDDKTGAFLLKKRVISPYE